jgi:hypothetical protein
MFEGWDEFYLIVGSTAGALIGLMFVVATLTAGLESRTEVSLGSQVFFTPIVFDFAIVVVVSAISAVPEMPSLAVAAVLALCAIAGVVYTTMTTRRILRGGWQEDPHWSDKWFYGILPAIDYIGLAAAAGLALVDPRGSAYGVGAAMLILLLIGIRNAWDLATFLVQRGPDRRG